MSSSTTGLDPISEQYSAGQKSSNIERRHLTVPEALDIIARISRETTITGYSLREWTRTREVLVYTDPVSGHIWGVALIHRLFRGWSEIAVVFVPHEYRGRGVGRRLVNEATRLVRVSRRRVLMFFSSDVMGRIATGAGLETYVSDKTFTARSFSRLIFMRVLYPPQWRASRFRRDEIRRKTELFESSFTFKIASAGK